MRAEVDRTGSSVQTGKVAGAVIGSFMVYALIVGLEGTGRHFVEIGGLRMVLFAALLAFARASGALARRSGRFGVGLAGVAAVAFLGGGIGAVLTDGWSFDVFAADAGDPPWYAYVIGASGILFALATVLVGAAGRSAGRLSTAVILGGATFPLAFALGPTAGHVAWLVPWMILAVGLARGMAADSARAGRLVEAHAG
jgi:hypothetical protein